MPVAISRVSIEHYDIPLGIEESKPRLSWRFENRANKDDSQKGWKQIAYEICFNRRGLADPIFSKVHEHVEVPSAESVLVEWPFAPLQPRQGGIARVRSHGSDGSFTNWEEVYLEAGPNATEFDAKFISGQVDAADSPKRPFRLVHRFHLDNTPSSARIYATAFGLYELFLYGERVGDQLLTPGWQSYRHRLAYQTYDISNLLRKGENVVGAWIGEGWYAGRLAWCGQRNHYGDRLGLKLQLEVDGEPVVQTKGRGWGWNHGALVSAELYDGEVYDAGLEDQEWKEGKAVDDWRSVEELPDPAVDIFASQSPPIREVETFPIASIATTPSGKTILDFGQNFAGHLRILRPPPSASREIIFSHAEVLEDGELGTRPLRDCRPIDRIILSSPAAHARLTGHTPRFTFHGFRYVQVDGWEGVTVGDVEGVLVHSAMERTGTFNCDHSLINRLHQNVVYSTLSNTVGLPSDCPQRDERLGWTGDIQVFGPTINYLFDSSGFISNWLKDLAAEQAARGGDVPVVIPNVIPREEESGPQAIWSDITSLSPADLHTAFGDKRVLRDQWESATSWLDSGVVRDDQTGLWSEDVPQLGDWLSPQAPPETPALAPTDNHLVANVYLIHTTRVASRIGRIVGDDKKASVYEEDVKRLTRHFYDGYVTPSGRIMSDTQTALALITYFDIYPSDFDEAARYRRIFNARLGQLVQKGLFRVSTGFAGTPIILPALHKAGLTQYAYRMLQEPTSPSFLSPVLLGATTVWERWDSMLQDGSINPGEMTSFNHYALGSVAHFMHSVIGGLSPIEAGWRMFLVQPRPGGTVRRANASFISPYGKVDVCWAIEEGRFQLKVEVPPNTTAIVKLPSDKEQMLGSGVYHFEEAWSEDKSWPPKLLQPPFCKPIRDQYI